MKWVRWHLGDWATAVKGQTLAEEAAYVRLLHWQYAHEDALPDDEEQVLRIVNTRNRHEADACRRVLDKHFVHTELGWVNPQAWALMADIGLFDDKPGHKGVTVTVTVTPAGHAVTGSVTGKATLVSRGYLASQRQRQRALRERKARLFDALAEKGVYPPAGSTMTMLRDTCKSVGIDPDSVTPSRVTVTSRSRPHAGESHKLSPNTEEETVARAPVSRARENGALAPPAAGKALVAGGLSPLQVNTSHPQLLALLDAGVTAAELTGAASEAVKRSKGFAYCLAMLTGQRNDTRAVAPRIDLSAWTEPLEPR